MHRAQLLRISPVRWNLSLFIFSWYVGRFCCSLSELNRLFSLGGHPGICSRLRRIQTRINFFWVHSFSQQSKDSCHFLRQSRLFCFHAACRGALVCRFWCWPVLGGSVDLHWRLWLYCITCTKHSSHAFHLSVKSDVVHFIVICWALLLPSLGSEQIVHTRWPTEIFVYACVEVKSISILLCASTPATKHR